MIEKTFVDRVPTYPGRVRITPVAGEENTFDMERADAATVEGTALNKAAFDSIVHSRLTGRYYEPTASRNVKAKQTIFTNPIPSSGWVVDSSGAAATNGSYSVFANSIDGDYPPNLALDGNTNTSYRSGASGVVTFDVTFPSSLKITHFRFAMRPANYTFAVTTELQGSDSGSSWSTLFSTTAKPESLTEYAVNTPREYSRYRLKFTSAATSIWLYDFSISGYEIVTYENAFVVSDGFPSKWDPGQRVMVQIPSSANTFGVVSNTLNGVSVSTILQPGKRYELRYDGAAFVAKEV